MPICPKCNYEFRPGETVCPDCHEPLMAHSRLKAAAETPDDSWVMVCQVAGEVKSTVAKGVLDSNNIPSIVLSSSFDGGESATAASAALPRSGDGSEVLMVPREFQQEAVLILQAVLGDDFQELDNR